MLAFNGERTNDMQFLSSTIGQHGFRALGESRCFHVVQRRTSQVTADFRFTITCKLAIAHTLIFEIMKFVQNVAQR